MPGRVVVRYPTTVPVADGQRRVGEIAEAVAFFLALLAYLWLLVIPLPWSGVLVLLAVGVSWRRRSLTPKSLGLGWKEFRASRRCWALVWIFSIAVFLILGYRSLFSLAALRHGTMYFAWSAAQQVVYQSMTYLPLRNNLKSRGLAAGLAGVAFSIMHVPNPVLVPATYVWGVASSLLFERSRTIWGLALLQMMLSSTLFWITPPELSRNFRIGPYYYEVHSSPAPQGSFARPISNSTVFEWSDPGIQRRAENHGKCRAFELRDVELLHPKYGLHRLYLLPACENAEEARGPACPTLLDVDLHDVRVLPVNRQHHIGLRASTQG